MNASVTIQFRNLLQKPGLIKSMGAHDVFSALIMEQAGLEVVFLGGFGASASLLGLPDLNFLTMTQMADSIRRTAARLTIPIIADGDTGHGDLNNVHHTVRTFEAAGAAGIILEDQVMPKRCGHFAKKQVIPTEDMVQKIQTAVSARQDQDFAIVARTDARQVNGLDDAIERINRCCEAGADIAFVEAPQSKAELEEIAQRVDHPLFANMLSGGVTPILSATELDKLGYKIAVYPIETLLVCAKAMQDLCQAWTTQDRIDHLALEAMTFDKLKSMLGLDKFLRH